MAGWRYLAQRVTGDGGDGEFIDLDLPLSEVEIEDALSAPPALTAKITPEYSNLVAPDGDLLLEEWGTAIWAEEEGEIRGGGIINHIGFDGPNLSIECIGFTGYPIDLPYTDSWYDIQIDPLDVVRHIWDHIQSKPGGNLGLEVDDLKTGLKIGTGLRQVEFDSQSGPAYFEAGIVRLAWYQNHDLASDIDQLAQETPFDYHERHFWDGETLRHRLDFGYPTFGRRREDLRFVIGENIFQPPSITRSGEDYASEVMTLGAGEGRTMRRGHASRPVRRLRRVAIVEDSSLRSLKSAQTRAEIELAARYGLDDFSEVVVQDSPHAPIGSLSVGDEIFIQGRSDWVTIEGWCRVLSMRIRPTDSSSMALSVVRSERLAG